MESTKYKFYSSGSYNRLLAFLIIFTLLFFIQRIIEFLGLSLRFGFNIHYILGEGIGAFCDFGIILILGLLFALVGFFLGKLYSPVESIFDIIVLNFFIVLIVVTTGYFLYQRIPLDIGLYGYSRDEILFTINTSGLPVSAIISGILFMFIAVDWTFIKLSRNIRLRLSNGGLMSWGSILGLSLVANLFFSPKSTIQKNKPLYFFGRSINFFLKNEDTREVNQGDVKLLYPDRPVEESKYPMTMKRSYSAPEYFTSFSRSPNVVILMVEGLNADFLDSYQGVDLMPFLDSLSEESLTWENCLTLGERSFAVVPSLLGGLPYGKRGFTLEKVYPRHTSLVSVLKANDYYTSFFYGQGAWFHNKDHFFSYNGIDLLMDKEKFDNKYEKIIVGSDNFFWGYNDHDLFSQSFEVIDWDQDKPRLDIYFTGSSHSPFRIPNKEFYKRRLDSLGKQSLDIKFFEDNSLYLSSLLFVDDALKYFFEEWKKRSDYSNTVFLITGDHPMSELPRSNNLKRYHVPLIMYSPQLKKAKKFHHLVSHLDVSESIYELLQNYLDKPPEVTHSLGTTLFDKKNITNSSKFLAFMNDNRDIIDVYEEGYFLHKDSLFLVNQNLDITPSNDRSMLKKLKNKRQEFKKLNNYLCEENRIISPTNFVDLLDLKVEKSSMMLDTFSFENPYYNFVSDTISWEGNRIYFDINLKLKEPYDDLSLVYDITNNKGESLEYKSMSVDKISTDRLFIVDIQNKSPDSLYFKSYLWNQKKQKIEGQNYSFILSVD